MRKDEDSPRVPKNIAGSVASILGAEAGERLARRFDSLCREYPLPEGAKLRRHLVKGILPGFALYRELRDQGRAQDEALASVDEVFEAAFAPQAARMRLIGRLPFAYALLRLIIGKAMEAYPAEGWRIDWRESSRHRVRFDMSSCYYLDRLRELGAPELTPAFCKVDEVVYGALAPRVEFRRKKTLGRGDETCDFCFARRGAE